MRFDDAGARIVVLVNAMTEAHQALLAGLHSLDVGRNVGNRTDIQQHPQDLFVRASVQRAVERRGGRGGGRKRIHL